MKKNHFAILLTALLLMSVLVLGACNGKPEPPLDSTTIIEPGLPNIETPDAIVDDPEPITDDPEGTEDFVDLGRASTLDNLMNNKAKITSYYFEHTINYVTGEITIKTWYYDSMMKIVSAFSDAPESVEYYDCYEHELISHMPAFGKSAIMRTLKEGDPDIPNNPLAYDYHSFRVVETDSIDGQICRVMERAGETLWVGTKYGFPMQVEFRDSLTDEHLIVPYENITINQTTLEDVTMPDDLDIYEMKDDIVL